MNPRNKTQAKKVLLFYWQKMKKYKVLAAGGFIFATLAQLTGSILPPLILVSVIDKLSSTEYDTSSIWHVFGVDIMLYALALLSSGVVFWRLADFFIWRLEGKMTKDMSKHVYRHLLEQSSDFHANNFGGSLVSNNNKLLSGYIRIADTSFYGLLPLAFTVIATAIILASRAPQFAITLVIFSIIYVLTAYKVSVPVRIQGGKLAVQESRQTGYLADSIANVMAIKSFAKNQYEYSQYSEVAEKTRMHLEKLMHKNQIQMLQFSILTNIINIGALVAAIIGVSWLGASIATAFLIFNYTSTIVSQLFRFSNQALRNYNRAIGDASEMIDILSMEPEVQDVNNPQTAQIVRGSIRFDNITFGHKDSSDLLFDNLNLSIKPGEKVGLVGHSGSGKTTLTKLLLRYSDVQEGAIKIDEQDISKISQDTLREAVAYVPQEPLLFHRSIAENIGYSKENASKKEIEAIAKQANVHEFVDKLPKKYETLVGERGVKLSGGQRQRIAIARAMLKNAPILVLDEATSALDSESEELIQDALWKLMEGRTAIAVAHRLSTIQKMDRILVMDNGKIIEEGSHKELIKQNGAYSRLWQKQSGGFIEE